MPVYKVKNWDALFETYETKKLKRLTWVPMPNKHDGKGYRRILKLQHGPMVYAAWLLILQVASKCEPRGILRDEDGPLSALDLSDKTGFPEKYFELAFNHLTAKEIGWLESDESAGTTASHPVITASHPEVACLKGMEGNGIEETTLCDRENAEQTVIQHAEKLYLEYPRHIARPTALKAIKNALKKADFATLLSGVMKYKAAMTGKDSQYIAHPATWFNQERWTDEAEKPKADTWIPKTDLSELPDDIFEPEARK